MLFGVCFYINLFEGIITSHELYIIGIIYVILLSEKEFYKPCEYLKFSAFFLSLRVQPCLRKQLENIKQKKESR